jgi:hypothetical protein
MRKFLLISILVFQILCVNAQNSVPTVATTGTLEVKATTVSYNGDYAPSNYFAVWVVNNSGAYIKTLYACTSKHPEDLINWININPSRDKTDAVSSATLSSHAQRTATWNGTNKLGVQQEDGLYTVKIEMTENENGTSKLATFQFTKGTTAQILTPANVTGFSGISIKWTPTNTAIQNIELATLYSIYPNPATSTVFVNGPDIQSIDVFTLEGKRIFSSNQQKLNIAALKKGTYMLSINTGKGIVSKKLIKN